MRALELVILVKPIGILMHVLMRISFEENSHISVLLKGVGISVIYLVSRFSLMTALNLGLKKRDFTLNSLTLELNKHVEHVCLSLHF